MKIHSKIKDYCVDMRANVLESKKAVFGSITSGKPFYFIDSNINRLYGDKLRPFIGDDFYLVIDALETNKSYANLTAFYEALIENNFTRNDMLVTIGGGILQDISGFIASTLYRGVKWIYLPTTLLAQADSCIGSKTSINFGIYKNLIGSFYPPDVIFIDTGFCHTLTDAYFNSGLGEVIKFHLMSDEARYQLLRKYLSSGNLREGALLNEIILSTLAIKKSYFESDEFDTGRRNLLNYGHCLGHALESATNFAVCHGEAVLIGIGFANLLSLKRGLMPQAKYREFEELLKGYYPRFNLLSVSTQDIIDYMRRDKKRTGNKLTMILSQGIGRQVKCSDIEEHEIKNTFEEFSQKYMSVAS